MIRPALLKTDATVASIMHRPVVTAPATDTLRDAVEVMIARDIGSILIELEGKPIGIVTERDIMRRMLTARDALREKLSTAMSSPLVTVSPDADPLDALELMQQHRVRRLPVLQDGQLVGIVTEKDLVYWILTIARPKGLTGQREASGEQPKP